MNDERKAASTKFLEEEVAEEIVIVLKVAHGHDLYWTLCTLKDGNGACDRRRPS